MTDKLLIQHEVEKDEHDRFHIMRKHHPVVVDVKHHYLHGDVSTHDGSVWKVKPIVHPDYQYVTVGKL